MRAWIAGCATAALLLTVTAKDARADDASTAETDADYMRLRHLVSDGAQFEYASQTWRGVYSMVLGAGIGGFSAYGYAEANDTPSKTISVIGMVVGGVSFLGGVVTLALNKGGALAEIDRNGSATTEASSGRRLELLEEDLRRAAERHRKARRGGGYVGIVIGGLAIIGGTLFFALDTKDTRTFRNTVAGACWLGGTGAIFQGVAALGWERSPVENTYNAWRRFREDAPQRSSVAPPPPAAMLSTPAVQF